MPAVYNVAPRETRVALREATLSGACCAPATNQMLQQLRWCNLSGWNCCLAQEATEGVLRVSRQAKIDRLRAFFLGDFVVEASFLFSPQV